MEVCCATKWIKKKEIVGHDAPPGERVRDDATSVKRRSRGPFLESPRNFSSSVSKNGEVCTP